MEEFNSSSLSLRISLEEELPESNLNDNFRNDEPNIVNSNNNGSVMVNPNCNNSINNNFNNNNNCNNFQNNNKNDPNDNNPYFNNPNTYIEKQNNYDNLHNTELNEIQRNYNNKNGFESNTEKENIQNFEFNENKKTSTNTLDTYNGKQIYVLNDTIAGVFQELFNTTEINLESKKDMQLLRKKNKRRTKVEIQKEKETTLKTEKKKKCLGRKRVLSKEEKIKYSGHSKTSDDNIMKKINSYFLESIRNWLNSSFIDENGFFQNIKTRKKLKKMFLKIDPKLITTNLKRETVMNIMNMKFKEIFLKKVSKKYMKNKKNENQKLIEDIYINQNQPFTLFILELKFIEALNYFNGQNNEDELKTILLNNNFGNDNMINQFISNFDKIDKFLKDIYSKEILYHNSKEEIEDYLQRISLLCLNYKEWYEKKFNRGENKKKSV